MNRKQRFFAWLVGPERAQRMEADSRAWLVRCNKCSNVRSVWDMGGIRWGVYGKPRWFLRCHACGRRSWHEVFRRSEPSA